MPCLESVTIGDDVWDENWLPLQAKMDKGDDAASHLFASSLGGKKPYPSCKEMLQKVRSLGNNRSLLKNGNVNFFKKSIHSGMQKDISNDNSEVFIFFPQRW